MKIKPVVAVAITFVLAVGTILLTQQMGIWEQGKGKKAPTLQADGKYLVEDIKGSYTFEEVQMYYGVPVSVLAEAFGIDEAEAATFVCKDLSTKYPNAAHPMNAGTVKLFVAFYLGAPFDLEDGSAYLPESAAAVVLRDGTPTDEQRAYLEDRTFDPNVPAESGAATNAGAGSKGGSGSGSGSGGGAGAGSGAGSGSGGGGSNSAITSVEVSGSTSLVEACTTYGVDAGDMMAAFSLTPDEFAFYQAKDLKSKFADAGQNIGPNSLKLFIALYVGAEYDLSSAETYLPASAADVLKAHGSLSAEQRAYLETHVV
ncbi:MAG: hypothetical protein RR505_12180 [Raoultibacter sp.]